MTHHALTGFDVTQAALGRDAWQAECGDCGWTYERLPSMEEADSYARSHEANPNGPELGDVLSCHAVRLR